jgi:hypothetical protein
MCRARKVLCAARDEARLSELKRAAAGANWELVGGAKSIDDLGRQVEEWQPDVVVVDAGLGEGAVPATRSARPAARIVAVGSLHGADVEVSGPEELRGVILRLPRPGGPVRA